MSPALRPRKWRAGVAGRFGLELRLAPARAMRPGRDVTHHRKVDLESNGPLRAYVGASRDQETLRRASTASPSVSFARESSATDPRAPRLLRPERPRSPFRAPWFCHCRVKVVRAPPPAETDAPAPNAMVRRYSDARWTRP